MELKQMSETTRMRTQQDYDNSANFGEHHIKGIERVTSSVKEK